MTEKDVKILKKMILTSQQHAKHPFSGQNTLQRLYRLIITSIREGSNFFLLDCRFSVSQPGPYQLPGGRTSDDLTQIQGVEGDEWQEHHQVQSVFRET